jgi:hypothetical protein
MRNHSLLSVLIILVCSACVDRITFDVGVSESFPIVIDGFISDEPGPYEIKIAKAFDIESKQSLKVPISVKRLIISDNVGNSEALVETQSGNYRTNPTGIRGTIGRSYKLIVELLDGRIYESKPDTLLSSGTVDDVYQVFKSEKDKDGATNYGFDVFFNSSGGEKENFHFLWQFEGTFQVDTNPELYTEPCGESRCPKPRACSSYIVNNFGALEYVKLCECCTCWAKILNDVPIVSDNQLVSDGKFRDVKAGYVPVNQWTFLYKVHVAIKQMSLSPQAFAFWKAVKAQKDAATSLFQPVTGKVPNNFIQISGNPSAIEGIFYATSINKKSIFITRNDVPNQSVIPTQDLPFTDSCLSLFPNSTIEKPDFWE